MPSFWAVASGNASGNLVQALGLDWRALLLNCLAFLALVWVLGRFVYPVLVKALDAKRAELEATAKAKLQAEAVLAAAERSAGEILLAAKVKAYELAATARKEAAEVVRNAEAKAAVEYQRIVAEARERTQREAQEARQALKSETIKLVADATEAVLDTELDAERDAELIGHGLESVRR